MLKNKIIMVYVFIMGFIVGFYVGGYLIFEYGTKLFFGILESQGYDFEPFADVLKQGLYMYKNNINTCFNIK